MEFRRINGLPPYVFATMNDLKAAARHAGRDVIDMGFGNPVPQDAEGWDYINGNKVPKHYYWHPDGLKGKAAQALVDLQQLVQSWEAELKQKEGFGTGVPKPKAPLQSRPEF